jgi:hypothetical protein
VELGAHCDGVLAESPGAYQGDPNAWSMGSSRLTSSLKQ